MTRIVAGAAKGRRLAVPPAGTRPTSDRAREGLFSSLASLLELEGARVLDLFAGTGAVGLEALSRGAAAVALVDSDRVAVRTIEANIAAVGLPGATAVRASVALYLTAGGAENNGGESRGAEYRGAEYRGAEYRGAKYRSAAGTEYRGAAGAEYVSVGGPPFDLVFADPPYTVPDTELAETLALLATDRWTRSGSLVVLERASSAPPPLWPDVIEPIKSRRYGAGMLWYGRRR